MLREKTADRKVLGRVRGIKLSTGLICLNIESV